MVTKLTLTPEAQARVDILLAADACLGPVPPQARLTCLVDEYETRTNGIVARAGASVLRFTTATNLRLASIKRYGLLGALTKVLYWKVSWHELAYRTERKLHLTRPAHWTEEAS